MLLVGLGGLGCAVAPYLASSGVGRVTLCDFDRIEHSNLARQILYTPGDVGQRKTEVAAAYLSHLNPAVQLATVEERIDDHHARRLMANHDITIDASDNYGTRLAVNRASLAVSKPWVMGSCIRMEGQLILFPGQGDAPCYRCVYGGAPDTLEDCQGSGVFAPVAGIIGTSMAHVALLYLAGTSVPSALHLLDATSYRWRSLSVRRNPRCKDCGP